MIRLNHISSSLPVALAGLIALGVGQATAQETEGLRFAHIFNDHMVLQCDQPLTIWGWAEPNAEVTVTITEDEDEAKALAGEEALARRTPATGTSEEFHATIAYEVHNAPAFRTVAAQARANDKGLWEAAFDPLHASFTPKYVVAASGDRRVAVQNVLVGEVWLTSGQSNMEWGLQGDIEWEMERHSADYPAIRYCRVKALSDEPMADFAQRANWIGLGYVQGNLGGVSGVSYYFAVRLHRYLKVPVGIYANAVGGTLAEQWTAREALESLPQLSKFLEGRTTSNCYNGMILPVSRFTFRGALFFQGENNSIGKWTIYQHSFPKMIENWRETFGEPDLPFGIVSLFGFGPHGRDMEPEMVDIPPGTFWYAAIRDAQFRTYRSVPNTGLIATWDLGDTAYIHPARKRGVGQRAARWALAKVYNKPVTHTAPVYREMKIEGNTVKLYFDVDPQTQEGRKDDKVVWWLDYPISREGKEYRGFVIAGQDRHFYPAKARRSKEPGCLEVWSEHVPSPAAVRFGWAGFPDANVIGPDHLPVHPFRTDDWALFEDPPYDKDSPDRQVWNQKLSEKKEQAERWTWQRKLQETRSMIAELERAAGKYVSEEAQEQWRAKAEQTSSLLSDLESALTRE